MREWDSASALVYLKLPGLQILSLTAAQVRENDWRCSSVLIFDEYTPVHKVSKWKPSAAEALNVYKQIQSTIWTRNNCDHGFNLGCLSIYLWGCLDLLKEILDCVQQALMEHPGLLHTAAKTHRPMCTKWLKILYSNILERGDPSTPSAYLGSNWGGSNLKTIFKFYLVNICTEIWRNCYNELCTTGPELPCSTKQSEKSHLWNSVYKIIVRLIILVSETL